MYSKDGSDEGTKYHPVRLEDMASLAKLSYGLDEVPFPLFTFPHGEKWLMGLFMNFNEDGPSYFLHTYRLKIVKNQKCIFKISFCTTARCQNL